MPDPFDLQKAARREAAAQQQAQQAMQMALQAALANPHTVTEISVSATTVVDIDKAGAKMLIVGRLTGDQIRIRLDPASARQISRSLVGRLADLEILENDNGGG